MTGRMTPSASYVHDVWRWGSQRRPTNDVPEFIRPKTQHIGGRIPAPLGIDKTLQIPG